MSDARHPPSAAGTCHQGLHQPDLIHGSQLVVDLCDLIRKLAALATDLHLAYADLDEEPFDVDYLARQLLMDVSGENVGTLLSRRTGPHLT